MEKTSSKLMTQLSDTRMNRRTLLRTAGAGVGIAAISPLLAACEDVDDDDVVDADDEEPAVAVEDDEDDDVVDDVDDVDDDDPEVDDDVDDDVSDDAEGVFGGNLSVVQETAAPNMDDPATGISRMYSLHVFETILSLSEEYIISPGLAEDWEWDDDGLVLTVHLRDDVLFHNGDNLVADDVVASVERYMDSGFRGGAVASRVDTISDVDDSTVEVTLVEPYAGFLALLASPLVNMAVLPREHIEGKGALELEFEDFVGTGPYQVEEFSPDEVLVLRRFDDYYQTEGERDGLGGAKVAYFDTITFTGVSEAGTRISGLLAGDHDYVAAVPPAERDRLDDDPGTVTVVGQPGNYDSVAFNHHEGVDITNNVTFRRAVQARIDVEEIALLVHGGDEDLFDMNPSLYRRVQEQWWTDAGAETFNQNDPERARELLEESGYDGEEIIIMYVAAVASEEAIVTAMTDQLEEIGINIVHRGVDSATRIGGYDNPEDWHLMVDGMSVRFHPADWDATFNCGSLRAGWCHDEMQAVFDEFALTLDEDEQKQLSDEFQRIHHEDVYAIKLSDTFPLLGHRSDIMGIDSWYISRFWGVWREE